MMKATLAYLLLLSQLTLSQPVCNVDECECTEPSGDNPCQGQDIGSALEPVTFKEIKCEETLSCNGFGFDFFGNCADGEDCKILCKADAPAGTSDGVCEDADFTVNGPGNLVEIVCEGDDDACDGTDFTINNPGEGFKIICKDTGVDDACEGATFTITIDSSNDVEEFGGIECIGFEACENAEITIINNNPDTTINLGTLKCEGEDACNGLDINFQGTNSDGIFFEKCECKGVNSCNNFGGEEGAGACFSNPNGVSLDCTGGLCATRIIGSSGNPVIFKELNCEEPKSCFGSDFFLECAEGEECKINCRGDPESGDGVCDNADFTVTGAIKEIVCEGDFACQSTADFVITDPADGFKFICKGQRACFNVESPGISITITDGDLEIDGLFCEQGLEVCAESEIDINNLGTGTFFVKEIKCDAGGDQDACQDLDIDVNAGSGAIIVEKIECKEGDCDLCDINDGSGNIACEDFDGTFTQNSAAKVFTNRGFDDETESIGVHKSSKKKNTQNVKLEIGTTTLAQIWGLFVLILGINCILCKYGTFHKECKKEEAVCKDVTFD